MNFTVYRSSAGSGKTFTLVREYLRIALTDTFDPPQRYRKILAITFTNKAAAEMKERIIRSLKELSNPDAGKISPMSVALKEELKLDSLTLATRSSNLLRAILHNYTDFAIGTIDSFTHRIVRAFAHDLRLPVNFEVETDADKLIREAVDILVGKIGDDPQLTELLVQFSARKADEEKTWQIEYELREIGKELVNEEGARNAELLRGLSIENFMHINEKLKKSRDNFEAKIIAIAKEAVGIISGAGLVMDDFSFKKAGIAGRFFAFSKGELDKLGEPNKNIEKLFSGGKWFSGDASKGSQAVITSLQDTLGGLWKKIEAVKEEEYPAYVFHKMLLQNIYAIAVLNEIERIIFSFRSEQNILHISEFNRIISRIVFAEPVPFIYERLGEKYSNYLIDEFQDTSVVQWQNLLPLLENSLAGNFFNMLVGDGKQAIYRWRGGEVEQFAKLPVVIDPSQNPLVKEREQSLVRNFSEQHLGKNFRSKSEIVQFNNSFFRFLSERLGAASKLIYDKLEQEHVPANEGGYIRIEELEPQEEEKNEIYIAKTLERIQLLNAEGWAYAAIAVLVRTNNEGSMIAGALIENKIPVLSSDSLLLKQSAIVSFMVSILRCIDFPGDELAGAQVLEYLVSTKRIVLPLHECLRQYNEARNNLQEVLLKNNIRLDLLRCSRLPIYQRCEEIITCFNLGDKADSYLVFFLDEILNYTNSRSKDKNDFFAYWEDRSKVASVVVPAGMNAVTVMTIHKSKGLEFPVVILPFANWKIEKHNVKKWITFSDPEIPELNTALIPLTQELLKTPFADVYEEERDKTLLDSLNVLYVGMTRPEHRLYVFTEMLGDKEVASVSWFFKAALERMNIAFVDHVVELGKIAPPEKRKEQELVCIRPEKIQSHSWENRVQIRSASSDHWDVEDAPGSRDKGNLLHEILAHITTIDDIDSAIEKAIQDGYTNAQEGKELAVLLRQLIALPELATSFSGNGKIRRETELLLPDGKRLRPDRVIENSQETIILDYKTGEPNERYKKQLNGYAEVLMQMGYTNIKKKIVYTETLKVESW
ncbi:UvrD-helicase domain-containing protein [soil metagenome]